MTPEVKAIIKEREKQTAEVLEMAFARNADGSFKYTLREISDATQRSFRGILADVEHAKRTGRAK